MFHRIKLKLTCIFLLAFAYNLSAAKIAVIDDGVSIQKPGVFTDKCYYGANESVSDHAPVIYDQFATWNVASPISHFKVQSDPNKPAEFFFNHKFFTDDQGNLVSRSGKRVGFGGGSEVVMLTTANTAEKIKEKIATGNQEKNRLFLKKQMALAFNKMTDNLSTDLDQQYLDEIKESLEYVKLTALREIDDPNEEKFSSTLEMLKILERSYASTTNAYIDRMEKVADRIKDLFRENKDLMYMALQEVPELDEQNIAGEGLQTLITELFQPQDPWIESVKRTLNAKEFSFGKLKSVLKDAEERIPGDFTKLVKNLVDISKLRKANRISQEDFDGKVLALLKTDSADEVYVTFYDPNKSKRMPATAISRTKFKRGMIPDVAIVARASAAPLVQELSDHDSRFVPWCAYETKTCYVSVHMPFTATTAELQARCSDMRAMATALNRKGITTVKFAGDFNTNASRMAGDCFANLKIPGAKSVRFRTSEGEKPNSCGSNKGHQGRYNIDVSLEVRF